MLDEPAPELAAPALVDPAVSAFGAVLGVLLSEELPFEDEDVVSDPFFGVEE